MSEIAKCPVCGEAPTVFNYYGQGYEKSYSCCDAEIHGLRLWNQYAAAMELAKALSWKEEIDPQIDWLGDRIYKPKRWIEVCKNWAKAKHDVEFAEKRVIEVFGGE